MRLRLPGIRRALQSTAWAIQPEKLEALLEVVELHATGGSFSAEEIRARIGERGRASSPQTGGVAVLSLFGVISHRVSMMSDFSGGTSAEEFANRFDAAMADAGIGAIVIDCDSPGGNVQGMIELADRIRAARGKGKKIIAVANATMASAAYCICAAADEIVAIPTGLVGAIGVYAVHMDVSEADAKAGIKHTIIKAGKHKAEDLPFEPLSDEALVAAQEMVDGFYAMFVNSVAKSRGVSPKDVRSGYGEGRVLAAQLALEAGLIDRVATLEDELKRLGVKNVGMNGRPRQAAQSAPARQAALAKARELVAKSGGTVIENRDLGSPVVATILRAGEEIEIEIEDEDDEENDPPLCQKCHNPMKITPDGEYHCAACEPDHFSDDDTDTSATAGGAAASASTSDPDPISRPQQAKEHTVPDTTAAHSGAGPESAAAVKAAITAEKKRTSEIRALGREHSLTAERIDALVDSDMSMEQVTGEILKDIRQRAAAVPGLRVGETREATKPFASLGENLLAIMRSSGAGASVDPRLKFLATATGMGESTPDAGGFAIQPDFSAEIIKRTYQVGEILRRVRKVPIGPNANGLKINAVDETSRVTGSRYGGIQTFWANEGDAGTAKKPKMRQMELQLRKLIGLWYATDELLQDSTALTAVAEEAFVEEITFMVEDAIINGTGSGQPFGILNSAALVAVAKESGQATLTFQTANAAKMFGRLWPRSLADAVWLINQDVWQQLLQLTLGSSAWPVWIPPGGVSVAPYGTLYGRPVIPVEYMASLTNQGDVLLTDLSQYLLIDKGGPQQAQSIHVRFVNDETTFRITYRVDGQPIWNAALTPKNGTNTMSPYIALAAR